MPTQAAARDAPATLVSPDAASDAPPPSVAALQHGWAQAYYAPDGTAREPAFQTLETQAAKAVAELPGRAEPLIWQGIIESSHAKFAGSLTALSLIKQAAGSGPGTD